MNRFTPRWLHVFSVAAVSFASACGPRDVPCSSGDIQSCSCPGGGSGTQSCDSNGTFTACNCPAEGGATDSGSDTEVAATDGGADSRTTARDGGGFGVPCTGPAGSTSNCTDPTYNTCELVGPSLVCTKTCLYPGGGGAQPDPADCPSPPTSGDCTPKSFCK